MRLHKNVNKNLSRAYMYLTEAMLKYRDADTGSYICVKEFQSLYMIFCFDGRKHIERAIGSKYYNVVAWIMRVVPGAQNDIYYAYALIRCTMYMTRDAVIGRVTVEGASTSIG
ncbi:hypothetical protein ACJMK2_034829 [Sinanodonta woodiana]|uniref:Uncharacterized protein n=1 Tax=Sinanodonta woodiana TaxID=1069815 RepID=A0ABD3WSW7_SINWO